MKSTKITVELDIPEAAAVCAALMNLTQCGWNEAEQSAMNKLELAIRQAAGGSTPEECREIILAHLEKHHPLLEQSLTA